MIFLPSGLKSQVSYLKARGFTLMEVMVAMGILGMIMTLVWSSSSQGMRARRGVEKRDLIYHQGMVALRKIGDDLSMAFLARRAQTVAGQPAKAGQPGQPAPAEAPKLTAEKEKLKTFLIGEDRGDADSVRFTSFSHMRLFKDAKESDLCKISYEIAASPDGRNNLVRREDAWIDGTVDIKSEGTPLAEGVLEFNVEYYDTRQGEWKKEWNTENLDFHNILPIAVKFTLTFGDPDDEKNKIQLSSAVMVPMSKGPLEY